MRNMFSEQYPDKTIRYLVLFDELVILVMLMLILGNFFWGFSFIDIPIPYLRIILICMLCYTICNMHVGVVLHRRFVRAEIIFKSSLLNQFYFLLLTLACLWQLNSPIFFARYLVPFYTLMTVGSLAHRWFLRKVVKRLRSKGRNMRRLIFLGGLDGIEALYTPMLSDSSTGFELSGYFNDQPTEDVPENIKYLGKPHELIPFLERHPHAINQIYCTLPSTRSDEIGQIVRYCDNHLIHFYAIPIVHNYLRHRMSLELMNGVIVLSARYEPLSLIENRFVKRAFDILCSSIFLLTIFPFIFLIFGLAIKLTSPGPIFFRQKRSGEEGSEFWCYKFRSMRVNAQSDTLQATEDDPRKTRLGDFMRKTSIDELPQFINVFLGDMSIVGPRPHMLKHTEEYSTMVDKYMVRHFVKPGITGWAQISGFRGETKELWQMAGRVEKDIWYIEHWSFWLDLYIIVKTVTNAIKGEENAY